MPFATSPVVSARGHVLASRQGHLLRIHRMGHLLATRVPGRAKVVLSASRRPGSYDNNKSNFNTTSDGWTAPTQLTAEYKEGMAAPDTPLTVYSLRFQTSYERGSALSEPNSFVNVCLVAKDGRALLQRVLPVNDPVDTQQHLTDICKVADEQVGANCAVATASTNNWRPGQVKLRFQEGSIDEISVLAPDLGPLSALLLSTGNGTWTVDEVIVSSSRTRHMDRFVCRRKLGSKSGNSAAYMTPVPPDAVVYGSGDSALVLTKEQAAVLRNAGMSEYETFKNALLTRTAVFTAIGTTVAAIAAGLDAAVPFATGGTVGILYQWLLQLYVDSIVPSTAMQTQQKDKSSTGKQVKAVNSVAPMQKEPAMPVPVGPPGLTSILGNNLVRSSLVFVAVGAAFWVGQEQGDMSVPHIALSKASLWQLLMGVCGFFTYKLAILSVSLAPQEVQLQTAKQVEKSS